MTNAIDVMIGNRPYKMAVEANQEERVKRVAQQFDQTIETLRASAGDMDRDRLLVLAAMMMSDDLLTLKTEKDQQEQSLSAFHETLASRLENLIK